YHRPSDTPDKINLAGMKKVVDMGQDVLAHFAAAPERPKYVKLAADTSSPRVKGPTLGIAPDYNDKNDGLLIASVSPGRPAEKAGLKSGDKIVSLANRDVRDINTYMAVMATVRAGELVEVIVLRQGKRVTLKVTPDAPK